MNSIFSNQSSRIYCISGNLHDVFCTRDLQIMNFDMMLDRYLRMLKYEHVYFYSFSNGTITTFSREDNDYITSGEKKEEGVKYSKKYGKSETIEKETLIDEEEACPFFCIKKKPSQFPLWADRIMKESTENNAIIVTSLSDYIKNETEIHREMSTCFDKWKDLNSSNNNIFVFMEKNLDFQTIIKMLIDEHEWNMASLFMDDIGGNKPVPKKNSCLFVSNPRYDEIENLLEYLRIVGYEYITTNGINDKKAGVTLKIDFDHIDEKKSGRIELARSISYYSRECERLELKMIKEALENSMCENYEATGNYVLTMDTKIVKSIYSDSHSSYEQKTGQELEKELEEKKGWESASKVVTNVLTGIDGMNLMHKPAMHQIDNEVSNKIVERIETRLFSSIQTCEIPNFVLQGPPGVGKTEIANIIGRILNSHGILRSGHTIIASRDKLVGQWVGSSAINTAKVIEQAQEGVLLIDEVYSLAENNEGSGGNSYCKEVIDTLVAAMTNKENHICFIFSGYKSRMDEVWKMNEGLFDRFGEDSIITIEEYDAELIKSIFCNSILKELDANGEPVFIFSDEVKTGMSTFFENFYSDRDRENYANARTVNNLASSIKHMAITRGKTGNSYLIEKSDFGNRKAMFEKRGLDKEEIFTEIKKYPGLDFLEKIFVNIQAIKMEYDDKKSIWLSKKENENKKLPVELEYPGPMHMLWIGNPGSGKSTAAKLVAELYHELGIFGGKEPIYVDAGTIKGKYIGSAEDNINKMMDEAKRKNTVLVIEEAYQLIDENFGKAALNAMLNRMEDERKHFNIIFILYKNQYKSFLDMNPGLESRMTTVVFNDYKYEELCKIFNSMLSKSGDTISKDAEQLVFEIIKRDENISGNARKVRKMIETMRQIRFSRIWDDKTGWLVNNDRYMFTKEDVAKLMEVNNEI